MKLTWCNRHCVRPMYAYKPYIPQCYCITMLTTETESSSGWLSCSSLETLELEVTTSYPDDLFVSVTSTWLHLRAFPVHDDVIKWKHFPRYWPFVRGIHWWFETPSRPLWRQCKFVKEISILALAQYCLNFTNDISKGSVEKKVEFHGSKWNDNISALFQVMAWCRTGDKPSHETMISQCHSLPYMCLVATWVQWFKQIFYIW